VWISSLVSITLGSLAQPRYVTRRRRPDLEFKINYVAPAKGEKLVARANALSVGRRQAVCQCLVYSSTGEEESLVAVAQGTITAVTPLAQG